jgi:hypothetical protein
MGAQGCSAFCRKVYSPAGATSGLGHSLQVHSAPVLTNVRYAPKATASRRKATRR